MSLRNMASMSDSSKTSTGRGRLVWRFLMTLVVAVICLACLVSWLCLRDRYPSSIEFATADSGGLYFRIGECLEPHLAERTGRDVHVLDTEGTRDNVSQLISRKTHLAILQSGASEASPHIRALTPLYREPVHVIVRRDSGIHSVQDLRGRRIALGTRGSGMRRSALCVLGHYRISEDSVRSTEHYFKALLEDPNLDGAIVTTGILNPDLRHVLGSGLFELLPILDADAITILYPHFTPFEIPRGLFAENPTLPLEPVRTVATTSYIAAHAETSDMLVGAVLAALYDSSAREEIPTLLTKQEAMAWSLVPRHSGAVVYFEPYKGLRRIGMLLEKLAATKELLVGLLAAVYLLFNLRRWRRDHETEAQLAVQRERLDKLLAETARLERAQMDVEDLEQLDKFLDDVTLIKLRALEELQHESLRGDRLFLIFLTQCANVIRKIQSKIDIYSREQMLGGGTKEETRNPPGQLPTD